METMVERSSVPGSRADDAHVVAIQSVVRADIADFEGVYEGCYRDVYRYLLGLTRSSDDADDLAAETFERAFRAWPQAEGLRSRPLPWLLLTARNLATDRWRRARRLVDLLPLLGRRDVADSGEPPSQFWLWFASVARVLTDHQREVLLLRYQRDLTDADIATVMGLSQSGVRSLVARALDVLRAHPELLE
jgi:RNA polymerase sigma factor (sigma-70 family)